MVHLYGRTYPGREVNKAPKGAEDIDADIWLRNDVVCLDPTRLDRVLITKYPQPYTEEDGIKTHQMAVLAAVPLEQISISADGHYTLIGVDRFDEHAIGIWYDVIQGTPEPGFDVLLGFSDNTFQDERRWSDDDHKDDKYPVRRM